MGIKSKEWLEKKKKEEEERFKNRQENIALFIVIVLFIFLMGYVINDTLQKSEKQNLELEIEECEKKEKLYYHFYNLTTGEVIKKESGIYVCNLKKNK